LYSPPAKARDGVLRKLLPLEKGGASKNHFCVSGILCSEQDHLIVLSVLIVFTFCTPKSCGNRILKLFSLRLPFAVEEP
jgi:hypothetical protein